MRKKIIGVAFAFLLAIGLTGCGGSSSSTNEDAETIGFSISTLTNPFFVTMKEAAEAKAKEVGVNLEVLDAKDDSATQTSDIENLVNKGIKVIIVNPTDSAAVAPTIKTAIEKGVKIISVDRSVDGADVTAHIASDNVAGGKIAGDYIVDKLGGSGGVIELEGKPGASAAIERGKGFEDAIAGKLDLIAKQAADFERAKGLTVMENLAQAHSGKFKAVYAQNDEMILGALPALEGIEGLITVGFDGGADALQSIKDGKLTATIMQQPNIMGEKGVETAFAVVSGKDVDKTIPVDTVLVTSDNVAEYLK
ncbi:substrate-binding domain-containing protein [Mycoplasma sp. P36-A1]|uniref:substrate-binding domain-containing protein n=1 Tax=Mycoplasma sp. P36-A1 TaxID=3252900 RepID=UPI003C2C9F28